MTQDRWGRWMNVLCLSALLAGCESSSGPGALQLVAVGEREITPTGVTRAVRPDAVCLGEKCYVGYTRFEGTSSSFGLATLGPELTVQQNQPVETGADATVSSMDLRLGSDGQGQLYAPFETMQTITGTPPLQKHCVSLARYVVDAGGLRRDQLLQNLTCGQWDARALVPPSGIEQLDDPAPFFDNGRFYLLTRIALGNGVPVRLYDAGLKQIDSFTLDLQPAVGTQWISVFSIVRIEARKWLVGAAWRDPPGQPTGVSHLVAIPLSDDLRSTAGAEVNLSPTSDYEQYVAGARYSEGKLYLVHNVMSGQAGGNMKGVLKVFDVAQGFQLLQEVVINDAVFKGDDHLTLELFAGELDVFFPTPEDRLMVNRFRWQ